MQTLRSSLSSSTDDVQLRGLEVVLIGFRQQLWFPTPVKRNRHKTSDNFIKYDRVQPPRLRWTNISVCHSDLPPLENLAVFDEERWRSSSQRVFSRGRPSQQRVQETHLDQQRPAGPAETSRDQQGQQRPAETSRDQQDQQRPAETSRTSRDQQDQQRPAETSRDQQRPAGPAETSRDQQRPAGPAGPAETSRDQWEVKNSECAFSYQQILAVSRCVVPTWARSVQTASDCLKEVRLFCFPADARLISDPALSCTGLFPVSSSFWTPRSTSTTLLSDTQRHTAGSFRAAFKGF